MPFDVARFDEALGLSSAPDSTEYEDYCAALNFAEFSTLKKSLWPSDAPKLDAMRSAGLMRAHAALEAEAEAREAVELRKVGTAVALALQTPLFDYGCEHEGCAWTFEGTQADGDAAYAAHETEAHA